MLLAIYLIGTTLIFDCYLFLKISLHKNTIRITPKKTNKTTNEICKKIIINSINTPFSIFNIEPLLSPF